MRERMAHSTENTQITLTNGGAPQPLCVLPASRTCQLTPRHAVAGQPAPEILYLCTTCGETLRNNGEDGRWRRRRRPSSAPAAGRRRGGTGLFGGGNGAPVIGAKTPSGEETVPAGTEPQGLSRPRRSLRARGERRGRRGGDAARLRYAHCARIVQHAYRNFRHRQYLRDWAFSLVRGRK